MTQPALGMPFPGTLTPDQVSAVLRDPDEGPDALYPSRIGVFCDDCGTVEENDYLVNDRMEKQARLEAARAALRAKGWSCTPDADLCPNCHQES